MMHPPLDPQAVVLFNQGYHRDALLAFEAQWHHERTDLLRALINLCNALHQLRLGLISAPRHNLAIAATLLAACPAAVAASADLDLARLQADVAALQALIPADVETGSYTVTEDQIPAVRLHRHSAADHAS